MAFYTWIDTATAGTNVLSESNFSSDTQRASGFTAGTLASSIRVNTALRQSTLVTKALMDALELSSYSYLDNDATMEAQVKTALQNLTLGTIKPNEVSSGLYPTLTSLTFGALTYLVPSGTSVVANPTLAGTENDLTGIQVGSTKYANHKVVATTLWSGSQVASTGASITLSDNSTNYDSLEVYFADSTYQFDSVVKCRHYAGAFPANCLAKVIDSTWSETQIRLIFEYLTPQLRVIQGASMFNITKVVGYKFI